MSRHGLFKSTAIVGVGTALSRILGFAREILMAKYFGTTLAQSAFTVAFAIPNLFRRLFGEGALSAAFIPVFSETLQKDGLQAANRLAGKVMTLVGALLVLILAVSELGLVFALEHFELGHRVTSVLSLLLIMMPYMVFICLAAGGMAILNSLHRFAVSAMVPMILNLVLMLTIAFVCPRYGDTGEEQIRAVAWAVLAAGAMQLLALLPQMWRNGIRADISFDWRDPLVRKVLVLMGPAAIGMGVFQINVVVDRFLAMWASEWAPAALSYAERLIYLPMGIFATALGTVLLPTLSRQAASSSGTEAMRGTVDRSIRNLMLIMFPAAVGLLILARPIVELSFQWHGGVFDGQSAARTARALMFYAPGLVVFSLHRMLVPAFYAMQDTRTPVSTGLWAVALNFVLNVTFVLTLPYEYKHAGIALATVIASAVNCLMLAGRLKPRIGALDWAGIGGSLLPVAIASGAMGVVAFFANKYCYSFLEGTVSPKLQQVGAVGLAVLAGMAVYGSAALVLCRREVRELASALRRARK